MRAASTRVPSTDLTNGLREVVAHRALREMQLFRDIRPAASLARQPKDLPFPIGERIGVTPRFNREFGINRTAAGVNTPDRIGKPAGGSNARSITKV